MSQRTKGVTRHGFLLDAGVATSAVALTVMTPTLAAAGEKAAPKLGAQLIGKLEGPEIIRDPAKFPTIFVGDSYVVGDVVGDVATYVTLLFSAELGVGGGKGPLQDVGWMSRTGSLRGACPELDLARPLRRVGLQKATSGRD